MKNTPQKQELARLIFEANDDAHIRKLHHFITNNTELLNTLPNSIKESIEATLYENTKTRLLTFGPQAFGWGF